jgi:hypothetical protein
LLDPVAASVSDGVASIQKQMQQAINRSFNPAATALAPLLAIVPAVQARRPTATSSTDWAVIGANATLAASITDGQYLGRPNSAFHFDPLGRPRVVNGPAVVDLAIETEASP